MLARIVESGEVPFRIKYVRAQGKHAGEVKLINAYYGAPKPDGTAKKESNAPAGRKPRKSHLESNSIPLTEFGSGRMLTPFISHILEFNAKQVIH